jgi:putative peptidoglycan lipid II flippase
MYQRGDFVRADTLLVYLILAAYALGLLASTATRLYASALYALGDTKTPAKIAVLRVTTSALIGALLMGLLEPIQIFGMSIGRTEAITVLGRPIGAAGLAAGAAFGAWLEFFLLSHKLGRRVGNATAAAVLLRLVIAALLAAAVARGVVWVLPPMHRIITLFLALIPFGAVYFGLAHAMGVDEVSTAVRRVLARLGVRRRV